MNYIKLSSLFYFLFFLSLPAMNHQLVPLSRSTRKIRPEDQFQTHFVLVQQAKLEVEEKNRKRKDDDQDYIYKENSSDSILSEGKIISPQGSEIPQEESEKDISNSQRILKEQEFILRNKKLSKLPGFKESQSKLSFIKPKKRRKSRAKTKKNNLETKPDEIDIQEKLENLTASPQTISAELELEKDSLQIADFISEIHPPQFSQEEFKQIAADLLKEIEQHGYDAVFPDLNLIEKDN
jgi:hypothetical protein